ncbi:MAG: hypothetical protein ACOX2M_08955 [Fastidiosipilaceae bacterium]|jgi:cell division protein FtsL
MTDQKDKQIDDTQYKRDRQIWRANSVKKNRKTAFAVFIIFLASLFAGVVLLNQSRTIALNFEKARLEEKIKKLTIANTQAESELVENINLEIVRKAAVEMGLMEPAAKQIRILVLPEEDTLEIDKADNGK